MIPRRHLPGILAFASGLLTSARGGTAQVRQLSPGISVRNAREVRTGWGVNVPNQPDAASRTAAALGFLGTRWVRLQFDGDTSPAILALQQSLVERGGPEPDLKLQLLLNGYLNGASHNSWDAQQRWILQNVLPIRRSTGGSVLAAIEGPNEVNSANGGGSRGPNDLIDKTGGLNSTSDNPVANQNFLDWARHLAAFKSRNALALRSVEILSPTILYFYPSEWSRALDVSNYVDHGTFHYYSGIKGTGGVPSWSQNPDNFARMYHFAQAGITPKKPLVQSEGGCSTEAGGGYAADGRSGTRYHLMQLLDHFAVGGHRYIIYNLFNNRPSTKDRPTADPEDNFGLYYGDRATPKPAAKALHNLSNLLSLGNRYDDPRNQSDTAPFVPAFDGSNLSIHHLRDAGSAGHALVMPKSDGTTMIAVWNEPLIDTGTGISITPAPNSIVVDLGSNRRYRVYDPTGGNGSVDFVARPNTAPIAIGISRRVDVTLYGSPILIEIVG